MVGIGAGARRGRLIKNAEVLELMAKVDTLVIDKTGTLTEGKIRLNTVQVVENVDEESLLQLAAVSKWEANIPYLLQSCLKPVKSNSRF